MNNKRLWANYLIPIYFNIIFEKELKLMTMEFQTDIAK